EKAFPIIEANDCKGLQNLMKEAVAEFSAAIDRKKKVPVIGVVGEIYVKYNGFSNKFVINWLEEHGVEVVAPALFSFFNTSFVDRHINREKNIKQEKLPLWINDLFYKYLWRKVEKYEKICKPFPFFRPFTNIFEYADLAKNVVNMAGSFGEGWFLPGEISHLAQQGIQNVVSLQPFGCIANHIISKGIEKKIKQIYPQMSLLFLDFDSGTSEANVFNRLHFMVKNCKSQLQ
ncbi:MAG: 2-hydroxyglutaryl-CoA dehydratase, partial [Bacteroidales bacterium]|nr:2-hydroxyglutaryl-CoA dehydratase [Bacteroidales bacterium]